MEQYGLTAKQFIYLCLKAGAERIYGIEDAFRQVKKENLVMEFSKVQKELMQNRYMRMDFDGNETIKGKLLEEIKICALCDCAVLFTVSGDKENKKKNYYFLGDKVVSLVMTDRGYLLERVDKEKVISSILEETFDLKEAMTNDTLLISVKQKDVVKTLQQENIRKYRCFSLVKVQKQAEKKVSNFMFLETNKGILQVKNKIVALDNVMDIKSSSIMEMKEIIKMIMESV